MTEPKQTVPSNWDEASRWLARAHQDLRVAEALLNDSEFVSSAAFHCQQAAEKMAKAVLLAFRAGYPKIHDIAELGRLVDAERSDIGEALADLSGLTDWYITSRYPDIDFTPSQQDVRAALGKLKELRQQILALAPKQS